MSELEVLKTIPTETGFVILPIHYTHDPDKQDVDWLLKEQAKYMRESLDWQKVWNREMELDFTAVSGSPAYPAFSATNQDAELICSESLPICLCCDFNVEPMVWVLAHIKDDCAYIFDEIFLSPGCVDDMVEIFRNRYPAHPAGVWIYGDATGRGRTAQTAKSYYDLLRISFRGYSSDIRFKVPVANPSQRDRLNAVNLKLRDFEGNPGIFIHPKRCPELVKDLIEVVTKEDGMKIVKVGDRNQPYFWRTHASDAFGYFIWREWPVIRTASKQLGRRRSRQPMKYYRILGDM